MTVDLTVTSSPATVLTHQKTPQTVGFKIAVWASAGKKPIRERATITATVQTGKKSPAVSDPTFDTGCTSVSAKGCFLSSIPAKRPSLPQVSAHLKVPPEIPTDDTLTVTFKVIASPTPSPTRTSPAPSKSAHPTHSSGTKTSGGTTGTHQSSSGSTPSYAGGSEFSSSGNGAGSILNAANGLGVRLPIGPLPTLQAPLTSTSPAGNAANLFPKISPSSVPNPAPGTPPVSARGRTAGNDTSIVPVSLGSSEFGAQVLGLVVLAIGIVIAVTRLSLRRTRSGGGKPPSGQ